MIRLAGRANNLARANALANALTRARDLASDLDNAGVPVGTLTRANTLARTLADASALNLDHTLDLNRSRNLVRDLASALASSRDARALAHALVRELVDLDPAAHWARAAVAGGGARSMPGRVPRGLVALAARLLPAPQRPRYHAEFRVELLELSSWERWGYAWRVLARSWELRRALVEAVCTPDGPARRAAER